MPEPLSDDERAILDHFREYGTPPEKRRAQIILLSNDCNDLAAIAQAIPLSLTQVRHWLREWEARRLDIFPMPPSEPLTDLVEPVPSVDSPRLVLELRESPGVLPDDPITEAARKILLFHFEQMLNNEPGSRQGEDIEAVHDMRVASRRMRSALRLFRPFFDQHAVRRYERELRRIAQTLGEVRDLDVFLHKAQLFASEHPGVDLQPLYDTWQEALTSARQNLIHELDSNRFARFVTSFHQFLTTPYAGARDPIPPRKPVPYQVRHVAPGLIVDAYAAVRAFEPLIEQADIPTLHQTRIAFKRLRYALEFFEEVLGPEARAVIKETKIAQDHLGDLQDAQVVSGVMRDLLDQHNEHYSGVPVFMRPDMNGVMAYARAKEDEKHALYEAVPPLWSAFVRDDVRQGLGLAIAAL